MEVLHTEVNRRPRAFEDIAFEMEIGGPSKKINHSLLKKNGVEEVGFKVSPFCGKLISFNSQS